MLPFSGRICACWRETSVSRMRISFRTPAAQALRRFADFKAGTLVNALNDQQRRLAHDCDRS